jgi:hypothetical protein
MHGRYATRSELWTWAAVREDALSNMGRAWRMPVLPQTRSLSLDSLTQTADRKLTCLQLSYTVRLLEATGY